MSDGGGYRICGVCISLYILQRSCRFVCFSIALISVDEIGISRDEDLAASRTESPLISARGVPQIRSLCGNYLWTSLPQDISAIAQSNRDYLLPTAKKDV